jgi:hypothetical protein
MRRGPRDASAGVRRYAPLIGIVAIAAIARYWAIDFCVPFDQCRPDEDATQSIVIRVFRRTYNPLFFDWPTLFMYAVTLSLVPYFKFGWLMGWFRGEGHFIEYTGFATGQVIIHARLVNATAGLFSVWVIYRIALRLFDRTTALVAALFLALAYLHARDSHFGVPDVTLVMFVLLTFLWTLRFAESGRTRDLVVAAAMAGLAASTKYNGALSVLPLIWVVIRPRAASPEPRAFSATLRRLAIAGGVMVAAFVATTPYSVLDWERFSAALRGISEHLAQGHGVMLGRGWVSHFSLSLWYGLGWPLLLSGVIGLALYLWRAPRHGILLALFPITYYLALGSGFTVFARYILPVVPFLCLGAAFAVVLLARWLADRLGQPARMPIVAGVLAACVLAPSAWSVLQFNRILARPDSRVIASNWILAQFPEGATINTVGRWSTRPQLHVYGHGRSPRHPVVDIYDPAAPAAPDLIVSATTLVAPGSPGSEATDEIRARLAKYTPVLVIEAFDETSTRLVYDWQDEFYIPLAGYGDVVRPGPKLTIYARPDVAAAKGLPPVR